MPPLRETKKRRTRQTLEDVSLRLFAAKGFDQTTVEEIAEEAQVSARTFFRYFKSKEDVVFSEQSALVDRLVAAVRARPGPVDLPLLVDAVESFADELEGDREALVRLTAILAENPSLIGRALRLNRDCEDALAGVVLERGAESQLQAQVLAGAAVAVIRAAMAEWHRSGATSSLPGLVRQAGDVVCPLASSG